MDQSLIIKLNQGTLNLIKIQIVAKDIKQEEKMLHINSLMVNKDDKKVVHTDFISMPTSSPYLDDNEDNKSWYEQSIFFVPSILTNSIEVVLQDTDVSHELIVRNTPIFTKYTERNTLINNFTQMGNEVVEKIGNKYHLFLNTDIAISYIKSFEEKFKATKVEHSLRIRKIDIKTPHTPIIVGLIGDDTFHGMMETSYHTIKLSIDTIDLISLNIFDIIIIQQRSSQHMELGTTVNEETTFINSMKTALLNTNTPILTLKENNTSTNGYTNLISLLNCVDDYDYGVEEYDICNFLPLNNKEKVLSSIIVSGSLDLNQFPEFLDIVNELSNLRYLVTVSGENYAHLTLDTKEKINESIEIYYTLSPLELSVLAKQSGFLLLNANTLKDIREFYNLCAIAITSGAIPIMIGHKDNVPKFVKVVNSASELYDFLLLHTDTLRHEKEWMKRYRFFRNLQGKSQLKKVIELYENHKIIPKREPSAIMICVATSAEHIDNVIENFKGQSYENLKLHIILNIGENDKQEVMLKIQEYQYPNIKFSTIEKSYSIGYCLNYGIRSTEADIWFIINDDCYYGTYYIEDMIHWYDVTDADSIGKPFAFAYSESDKTTYINKNAIRHMRTFLSKGQYLHNATLSGKKARNLPNFSNDDRELCVLNWCEKLITLDIKVFVADIYNFFVKYNLDTNYTVPNDMKKIANTLVLMDKCSIEGWVDAN